jgi:hypothetical protein
MSANKLGKPAAPSAAYSVRHRDKIVVVVKKVLTPAFRQVVIGKVVPAKVPDQVATTALVIDSAGAETRKIETLRLNVPGAFSDERPAAQMFLKARQLAERITEPPI